MNKPPTSDFYEILRFAASLFSEATPRALIIIGAARLEEEMKDIFEIALPGSDSEYRAHSSRVEILTGIGVLSDKVAFCLKRVARIRNYFAHTSAAVSLSDDKVKGDVQALYTKMEEMIGLSGLSKGFFEKMIAKIPRGMPPQTWVDDAFRMYQTAIVMLLWHLAVVRCNVPSRPPPIELASDGYW